jgi:hypothetical protein
MQDAHVVSYAAR